MSLYFPSGVISVKLTQRSASGTFRDTYRSAVMRSETRMSFCSGAVSKIILYFDATDNESLSGLGVANRKAESSTSVILCLYVNCCRLFNSLLCNWYIVLLFSLVNLWLLK